MQRYYDGKKYHDFQGLVWYDKENDNIFISPMLDGLFCALVEPGCGWQRLEILGFL